MTEPAPKPALLDSHEAAILLKISPATLQRLARAGRIPALKIGKLWRFRKADLDAWLDSQLILLNHPCRERRKTNDVFAAKISARMFNSEKAFTWR
jgi:excisionase family DNA binding protein